MQNRQDTLVPSAADPQPGVVSFLFSEGDQFNEAMRHKDAEIVQTKPGRFDNQTLLVPLKDVILRYGENAMPWICSATMMEDQVSLVIVTKNEGEAYQNGRLAYGNRSFAMHGTGAEHFSRTEAGSHLYVPIPEVLYREACRAADDENLCPSAGEFRFMQAEESKYRMLVETVEAIRQVAAKEPGQLMDTAMRAAMQQSLITDVVLASASAGEASTGHTLRPANNRHTFVVYQAQEFLRASGREPVYVLDLCRAAGCSERTLREAFQAYCGMGPMRYLKLRRLREARRQLQEFSETDTSVKAVALDNGFWELGRFAVEYRQLFGETPSETLHAPAGKFRASVLLTRQSKPGEVHLGRFRKSEPVRRIVPGGVQVAL